MRFAPCVMASMVLLAGCASSPFVNCDRAHYPGYLVLICDDEAVGKFCKRIAPKADNGTATNYYPRACLDTRAQARGKLPTMLLGKSYVACWGHEKCHLEYPQDPGYCERNFPCVGDRQ